MLAHRSGLIGLPLRLLAREVYGKLVARAGVGTARGAGHRRGEDRAAQGRATGWRPSRPCRSTSPVECLAIDEIQVADRFDRGHVFTNRILNARGLDETLLLGAATMRR
jgi:ATP-dependent RNA helicase SUPV3L1/SUV3